MYRVPMVQPARLLYIITYPQVRPVIHRGVGVIHRPAKPYPQVLKTSAVLHILPEKKFTLK
jgi:hypothetical protein